MGGYDFRAVEARWRARWEADGAGEVDLDAPGGDTFYNLVEFPYPSAAGLHIGHAYTYCGADVVGRHQRMRGRTVFQPMGFDAFGINAENYALKVRRHPAALMAETTARYRDQLRSLGAAWTWSAELSTCDPGYYRWTQWIFLRLLEVGLAYRAEASVLWCPSCLTVLAREQVDGDRCERCASPVTERQMTQWFLRITAYRDRLRRGLDALDWPERAKNAQRRWLDGLHDWLISRQRYWGPPIPVVHCAGCGVVPVPDADLPVVLPAVDDVRPTGTGESPLAAVSGWVDVACPACARPARRETDVSDTFLDSAWYFLRYVSPSDASRPWDVDRVERWLPVDFYAGGPEHVARHHLYARFITMALHDQGLVPFAEPFPRVRLHGILLKDGAKMSKSRGNVVNPDHHLERYGADVVRLYLLSCGRWDAGGDFRDDGIDAMARWLDRAWRVIDAGPGDGTGALDPGPLDAAIARVTSDVERLRFNTAITALRGLIDWLRAQRDVARPSAWLEAAAAFTALLAPFAPHAAEEMWERLGRRGSVHRAPWPVPTGLPPGEEDVAVVVEVDGRARGSVRVAAGAPTDVVVAAARRVGRVERALAGRAVTRVVHVPDRVVNLVTT